MTTSKTFGHTKVVLRGDYNFRGSEVAVEMENSGSSSVNSNNLMIEPDPKLKPSTSNRFTLSLEEANAKNLASYVLSLLFERCMQ